jgi:AcrR family transcriptional regulator
MARSSSLRAPVNTELQKGRRSTQRERILAGMVAAANHDGCAAAPVAAVVAEAGVSKPTFYEYFSDRDDCFIAALADVNDRLLARIEAAVKDGPPAQATASAITALFEFTAANPAAARFLIAEAMAAGRGALDERDRGLAQIERIVERAQRRVPAGDASPDIPVRVIFGAIYRLLASRLRRGEPVLSKVQADLLDWIRRFEHPASEHRWRKLRATATPGASPHLLANPLRPPAPLPPGRPRLSPEQVAENRRQRILAAVARLAETTGYEKTTIAEISKLAKVDVSVFYTVFANKQDAFMAVHERGFQQVMAVTAAAFFAGATWPDRVWEAARAFSRLLEGNPLLAHIGFVEAYAVGPQAVQRIEDSHVAFTIFLQEGYRSAPQDEPPTRTALEASITALFEIAYQQARRDGKLKLAGLLAPMTYLALAPFLGVADANAFIDAKLRE